MLVFMYSQGVIACFVKEPGVAFLSYDLQKIFSWIKFTYFLFIKDSAALWIKKSFTNDNQYQGNYCPGHFWAYYCCIHGQTLVVFKLDFENPLAF